MKALFGAIKSIGAAWQMLCWLRREKKELEADFDAYFSGARAQSWRLSLEKIFRALERGEIDKAPALVRWFLARTTVDDRVGWFGLCLLKSGKLRRTDPVLDEPIEPYRAH